MPNPHRSQPDKWLVPFRKLNSATLAPDEQLAFVLYFEVKYRKDNDKAHNMFIVVRKGDKAIARNVVAHGNDVGYCQGHADEVAEYDIKDTETLIDEIKNHGILMATMLAQEGPNFPLTIDTTKPIIAIQPPITETRAGIVNRLLSEAAKTPEAREPHQVIIGVLGLNEIPLATQVAPEPVTEKVIDPETQKLNNLEKAAKEMELIKKFGKKNMEELAKRMNYQGEVINKIKEENKTKSTHVNS